MKQDNNIIPQKQEYINLEWTLWNITSCFMTQLSFKPQQTDIFIFNGLHAVLPLKIKALKFIHSILIIVLSPSKQG